MSLFQAGPNPMRRTDGVGAQIPDEHRRDANSLILTCPGGGIGRHGGLKPPSSSGGAGSIPAPGTI